MSSIIKSEKITRDTWQIEDFVDDNCLLNEKLSITVHHLYCKYVSWANSKGRYVLPKLYFGKVLYNNFNVLKDRTFKVRFWRGIT